MSKCGILPVYAYMCLLWTLVGMIKMTPSLSYNIPGLDVDDPITVCDKAINYASMPGGVVRSGTEKPVPFTIKADGGEYFSGEAIKAM